MDLHPIQAGIVKKLMFSHQAKFSELNVLGCESNLLTFHLKQLINNGWIDKTLAGYQLSKVGISEFSKLDGDKMYLVGQPKVGVLVWTENIFGQILVCQRKKLPHRGTWGFPAGKVRASEKIEEAAKRCVLKETGVRIGHVKISGVVRINEVGFDRVMFYIKAKKFSGRETTETIFGKSKWVDAKQLRNLEGVFVDFIEDVTMFENSKCFVYERVIY